MWELFRKLFIADFDWTWKERWSFFWYQLTIFIVIFILFSAMFLTEHILNFVEISYFPKCWKYCNEKELFFGNILEITNNVLFILSLLFIFKFNSWLIERFSYFRFSWLVEKIFKIILTILILSIIFFTLFFIINSFLYFSWKNLFFIYEVLNFSKMEIIYVLAWIIFFEIFMFILWLLLSRKK